jgi:hypothetical protein
VSKQHHTNTFAELKKKSICSIHLEISTSFYPHIYNKIHNHLPNFGTPFAKLEITKKNDIHRQKDAPTCVVSSLLVTNQPRRRFVRARSGEHPPIHSQRSSFRGLTCVGGAHRPWKSYGMAFIHHHKQQNKIDIKFIVRKKNERLYFCCISRWNNLGDPHGQSCDEISEEDMSGPYDLTLRIGYTCIG